MPASVEGAVLISRGSRLLATFFRPAADGPRPTALLLHGIPGLEKNVDLAYALRAAGWNVLLPHYRGSWGSEGNYTLPGILDDILAAVDYLCGLSTVDPERLAGVGLSLGGWGVIMAAARDARLKAVVSLNPLVDPPRQPLSDSQAADFARLLRGTTAARVQTEWATLPPLPPVAAQLAGRPVLLLTGDRDELFRPEQARLLAQALPPDATWQRLPQANHTFDDHRPQVVRAVAGWLAAAFAPAPPLPAGLRLRPPTGEDHARVSQVLVEWWGGHDLRDLLPGLFFDYFADTSFIVDTSVGELAAFLIGFVSPSVPDTAFIHFAGVRPDQRRLGLGRALYQRFFQLARARGARQVRCVTNAENADSIAFHLRLGFSVSEPVPSADRPGQARVSFRRELAP